MQEVISKNDTKSCDQFTDKAKKEQCIDNINYNLALTTKNKEKCKNLKTKELMAKCNVFFQLLNNN
jgi:hypothetical protein